MNPILHYPVADPPFRRASTLLAPGRSSPSGLYSPGAVQQAEVLDDFTGGVAGDNLLTSRARPAPNYRKHPTWTGDQVFTDAGRIRHSAGSIAVYCASVEPMNDCIVSGRLYFTDGHKSVAGHQCGIAARISQDADTFYYAFWSVDSQTISLARRSAGAFTSLGASFGSATTLPVSTWGLWTKRGYVDLQMVIVGATIKLYVDGVERVSVVDQAMPAGVPGTYSFTAVGDTTGVHLENFSCSRILAPPAVAQGFTFSSLGSPYSFSGIRAIRTNGATILAGPVANLAGPGAAGPCRYQWFRSERAGELPNKTSLLRGQTNALLNDTQGLPGKTYYYRCAIVDSLGRTTFSDAWRITTYLTTDKVVIFTGNSLTFGTGLTSANLESVDYPTACGTSLGAPWSVVRLGIPSAFDGSLITFFPNYLPYMYDPNLAKCVVVHWEGTNGLNGTDNAVTALAQTYVCCDYIRSFGYKLAVANVIDRQQTGIVGDFATIRATYNTNLLSTYSAHADAHIDLYTLLPDSTNATNFNADKCHLTATGYGIVAGAAATAVAAL